MAPHPAEVYPPEMNIQALRFLGLLLAALTVGMKLAHTLELGPKLAWGPELYFPVQTSLYRYFALLGPVFDIGAILAIGTLSGLLRKTRDFAPTLAALLLMFASLGIWAAFVGPANRQLMVWAQSAVVPTDWMHWRAQWQYGQAACFVFDTLGFCSLLISVLRRSE